jgi:lambda family phage portal protein
VTKRRRHGYIRSVLQSILSPVATSLAGFMGGGYNVLDPRRKIIDRGQMFANKATANQLLNGGLSQIRTYCRHLERNNPTAQAAVLALDALVIGSGIDLEPDTGDDATNGLVRKIFYDWMRSVAVDGSDIYQLQHTAMRECPVAGEWVWRIIPGGEGPINLRVLPLEGEWLSDAEGASPANGCTMAAGVELDRYGTPVAYFLVPPEGGKPEKVAAASIIHGFEKKRSLQARGEPWFTPVIETLMNERDLVDVELKAATVTANIGLAIESEYHDAPDTDTHGSADDPVQALGLGSVVRLYPGEKVNAFHHTRPSQQIAPFRQMLRGDIAAALRIPQRFLDRDVSRANYSSMRADMLDTQRLLQPIREMVGHKTIGALYRIAAPYISAMIGTAIDPTRYRLLPDGQPYVDPVKDIRAATDAIAAGLSTWEAEIGARGGDYRQVWAQLAKEQKEAVALGIKLDVSATNAPAPQTSVGEVAAPPAPIPANPQDETEDETEDGANGAANQEAEERRHQRAVELAKIAAPIVPPPQNFHISVLPGQPPSVTVRNEVPAQAAPVVNVAAPTVNVAAPEVRIDAQPAPVVNVTVPQQPAPTVINQVNPTPITIDNTVEVPARTIKAVPQRDGSVLMTPQE